MYPILLALALAATPPTGVYKTAGAFLRQVPTLAGTGAHRTFFNTSIVVVNRGSAEVCRTKYPRNAVWGYVDGGGGSWRIVHNQSYQVEQTADSLAVYSQHVGGKAPHTNYFFSNGLAGPVQRLSKRGLRNVFMNDLPEFVRLVSALRWFQGLTGSVAPSAEYRVVSLYRQAGGK